MDKRALWVLFFGLGLILAIVVFVAISGWGLDGQTRALAEAERDNFTKARGQLATYRKDVDEWLAKRKQGLPVNPWGDLAGRSDFSPSCQQQPRSRHANGAGEPSGFDAPAGPGGV